MLGARYGTTAGGGMTTREYSGTTGAVWRGGGLIASAKRVIADPVDVSDRRYTAAMAGPNTLHPGSDLWRGLVSGHPALGETDRTAARCGGREWVRQCRSRWGPAE